MELDEHGLPIPAGFDEEPVRKVRAKITLGRLAALALVVLLTATIAGAVHFHDDLQRLLAQQFTNLAKDSTEAAFRRMRKHFDRGEYERALAEADKLTRHSPVLGHAVRGELLMHMGRPRQAIHDFNQAILHDPSRARLFVRRADARGMIKDYRGGIDDCTRALERDSALAVALNNRAWYRALARIELDLAFEDVEKALALDADRAAYIDTRGYLHYLLGRPEQALEDLNRALSPPNTTGQQMTPEGYGEVHFHRGLVYQLIGKPELAAKDFDRARAFGFTITEYPQPVRQETSLQNAPEDEAAPSDQIPDRI